MGGAQCQAASWRERGRLRAAAACAGRLGRPYAPALSAANRELRSLTGYEKGPAEIYAARAKLAEAIEALRTAW